MNPEWFIDISYEVDFFQIFKARALENMKFDLSACLGKRWFGQENLKVYFGLFILACFPFNFIMSIQIWKRLVKYKNPFVRKNELKLLLTREYTYTWYTKQTHLVKTAAINENNQDICKREMEIQIKATEREILENSREMPRFFLANLKSMSANYKHYRLQHKKKISNIRWATLITTKEEP